MRATAVILARAGSKGVPGKNWASVGGRPCVWWTIDAAKRARDVGLVVVSTDSPEVAGIARAEGCVVIERPADLASDQATVDAAARHAVEAIGHGHAPAGGGGRGAGIFEASHPVVILYANVPIRPPDLIDRALELLVGSKCDSVQSYAAVGKNHPWWMVRVDAHGRVLPWEGEKLYRGVFRRQDLPPALVPDGGVIAVTRRALFLEVPGVAAGPHAFLGADHRGVVNAEGAVVDIDSPVDLQVADAVLKGATGRRS